MCDRRSAVLIAIIDVYRTTGRDGLVRRAPLYTLTRTVALGRIYIIEFGSLDSAQHSKHYGRLVPIRSNRANERITSNGERPDAESLGPVWMSKSSRAYRRAMQEEHENKKTRWTLWRTLWTNHRIAHTGLFFLFIFFHFCVVLDVRRKQSYVLSTANTEIKNTMNNYIYNLNIDRN